MAKNVERKLTLIVRAKDQASREFSKLQKNFSGLQGKLSGLGNRFAQFGRSLGGSLSRIVTSFSAAGQGVASFAAGLAVIGPIAGGVTVALTAMVAPLVGIVAGVRALAGTRAVWSEQQQAALQLEAAWGAMGRSIPVEKIFELSSALQQTSIFGDEAISQGAKMLATFPQITDEMFPEAMQAMVDFASFSGSSIEAAARTIGKASMGMYGELSRLGITISDSTKKSKDFTLALKDINQQVGGQGVALTKTWSGALTQLKNVWGDLLEQIGRVQVLGFSGIFQPIIDKIVEFSQKLEKAIDSGELDTFIGKLKDMASVFADVVVELLEWAARLAVDFKEWAENTDIEVWFRTYTSLVKTAVLVTRDLASALFSVLGYMARLLKAPISAFGSAMGKIFGGVNKTLEDMSQEIHTNLAIMEADKQISEFEKLEEAIGRMLKDFGQGTGEYLDKLFAFAGEGTDRLKEAVSGAAKAFDSMKDSQKDTLRDLDESWEDSNALVERTAADRIEAFKTYFEGLRNVAEESLASARNQIYNFSEQVRNSISGGATLDSLKEFTKGIQKLGQDSIKHLQGVAEKLGSFTNTLRSRLSQVKNELRQLSTSTENDLRSISDTQEQQLRRINRAGLTEAEKQAESVVFISRKLQEAGSLMSTGNVEDLERAKSIYVSLQNEAGTLKNSSQARAALELATQGAQEAALRLEERKREELEKEKAALEAQIASAQQLRKEIEATVKALTNKLKVTIDENSLKQAIDRVKKALEAQKFYIKVQAQKLENPQSGGGGSPFIQAFATGGPSGTDTIPAWLSPGEYVVRSRAVKALGLAFMDQINRVKGYASGGPIGNASTQVGGMDFSWLLEFFTRMRNFVRRYPDLVKQTQEQGALLSQASRKLSQEAAKMAGGETFAASFNRGAVLDSGTKNILDYMSRQYHQDTYDQGMRVRDYMKDVGSDRSPERAWMRAFEDSVKTFGEGVGKFGESTEKGVSAKIEVTSKGDHSVVAGEGLVETY